MNAGRKTVVPVAAPLHVTVEQAQRLFYEVAHVCEAARHVAMGALQEVDAGPAAGALYALQKLLEQAGALADVALGGDVVGSLADWTCGPSYREVGR